MLAANLILLAACAADVSPNTLWIEAEAYHSQAGSVGPDRPPFGSRGACLGSNWAAGKGHFVVYRIRLDRPLADATLYLRYARLPESDSQFGLFRDGKPVAQPLKLESTAGWGHLRDDEWRYATVPLGDLTAGWHEVKLLSTADRNNTNLDGFFLAPSSFRPPNTRAGIETFPQPPLRRAANTPGPKWIDPSLRLDDFQPSADDWYYPREEPGERAALQIPNLVRVTADQATLTSANEAPPVVVPVGGRFRGWRVVQTLTEPEHVVVLEREFDRWGLIVYLGRQGPPAEIRKAVGRLERIARPHVRFPSNYAESLLAAQEDLLAQKVLASGGDASYRNVAAYLPPLVTYSFLGSPESPKKYIVQPDGSIGTFPNRWGADKPLETTLFDPSRLLPDDFAADPLHVKRGLLGGYLPAVNYGFWDAEKKFGWELSALMDVGPSCDTFLRVRFSDRDPELYQLEPLRKLDDGKPFFAALLRLQQSWQRFFDAGMRLDVDDPRVLDANRAAIARALSGYVGLHPKYGMGGYWGANNQHDGFPPTTLSLGTCLLDWGFHQAAGERLGYYLDRFVRPDGTLTYYGPAVAEYGQLLDLAATYVRRTGDTAWLDAHRAALESIASHLLALRRESLRSQSPDDAGYGLLYGGAEADTRKDTDYYFSGSAWAWRGLRELGNLFVEFADQPDRAQLADRGRLWLAETEALRKDLLRAVDRSVIASAEPPFLPPIAGQKKAFERMTEDRLASYTNYRYWLETLSARCLAPKHERMILDYRTAHGGELLAMTRFTGHLDDWPFWHQAHGLLSHDRVSLCQLGYYAHLAHHQTQGTFTAYEQVPIRGYAFRRESADYCVPAQLTVPIMTRWMLVFEERDADVLWLLRAAPRAWLAKNLSVNGASTRWGPVDLDVQPSDNLRRFTARITLPSRTKPTLMLRIRHPQRLTIASCDVTGGTCDEIDARRELVRLQPEADAVVVNLTYAP